MATTFIDIDETKFLGRQHVRAMTLLREGMQSLHASLAVFTTMVDGDGSQASQFSLLTSEGIYPSTAHAKASWDEIQSLNFVVSQAEAAILQACAKHGV